MTDQAAALFDAVSRAYASHRPPIPPRSSPPSPPIAQARKASGIAAAAVAVHWFAGEAFNAEVRRVARDGAAMAWIGYLPLQLTAAELQTCRFQARNGPSPTSSGSNGTGT